MAKLESTVGGGRTAGKVIDDSWLAPRWPQPGETFDWNTPRRFWSQTLAFADLLEASDLSHYMMPGRAKGFWRLLQSCTQLDHLWDHRPVEEFHALVLALAQVHWRSLVEADPDRQFRRSDRTRKQEQQSLNKHARSFRGIIDRLQGLPDELLPATQRDGILKELMPFVSRTDSLAKDPPPPGSGPVNVRTFGPSGENVILTLPGPTGGNWSKRGRPAGAGKPAVINASFAVLDTFLRPFPIPKGSPDSKPVTRLKIVVHFYGVKAWDPDSDSLPDSLRVQIAQVRKSHGKYVSLCVRNIRSQVASRDIDPLRGSF